MVSSHIFFYVNCRKKGTSLSYLYFIFCFQLAVAPVSGRVGSSLTQTKEKTSIVWKFFDVDTLIPSKALCRICHNKFSRGGSGRKASTTNLMGHLRAKHPEVLHTWKMKDLLNCHSIMISCFKLCLKFRILKTILKYLCVAKYGKYVVGPVNMHKSNLFIYMKSACVQKHIVS